MKMPDPYQSLKPKLPHVGTTIFAVMSKLAQDHGAINLSQGFPDFPVSPELIDRVTHYMKQGFNQYAPMTGVQPLREQICRKAEALYGARYHPEKEVNVTAGATQALYTAIAAVVHEGDEVILFSPAYDSYAPAVEVHGGIPVFSHLKPPDYTVDWEQVRGLVNRKTRMIVVNTPHNPTGSILTAQDMRTLDELTRGTDILVISDEVYEHIIYDGVPHRSAMLYPGLRERSFVVFSFGKTFHSTGWKMGYCLAPDELMQEFRSVHQFLVYCCNTPIQHALADFLSEEANISGISPMYQAKRDLFLKHLKDSRFKFTPTSGSYFQLLDYRDITDEHDMEFAVRMTREHKVASIPVSVFYPDAVDNRVLRFCFAKREETLERAAEILCRI
jgi:methionine aminotransferase